MDLTHCFSLIEKSLILDFADILNHISEFYTFENKINHWETIVIEIWFFIYHLTDANYVLRWF